jgi:hypothetical protein
LQPPSWFPLGVSNLGPFPVAPGSEDIRKITLRGNVKTRARHLTTEALRRRAM